MKLQMLLVGLRELWLTVIVAGVIVASPFTARAAFSDADLNEGAGCIGTWHPSSGKIGDVTDLMQLTFDGLGGVTGRVHFLMSGEDCLATIGSGSGYSINADGSGSLTLNLSFSGLDKDKDFNCAGLNSSKYSLQKIDIVLERAGHVFDMAAQDDFFNAPFDLGDTQYSFTGTCMGQGSF
jgi:hypothetical protein